MTAVCRWRCCDGVATHTTSSAADITDSVQFWHVVAHSGSKRGTFDYITPETSGINSYRSVTFPYRTMRTQSRLSRHGAAGWCNHPAVQPPALHCSKRILHSSSWEMCAYCINCIVNISQQHQPAYFSTHIDYQRREKERGILRRSWVLMNIPPLEGGKRTERKVLLLLEATLMFSEQTFWVCMFIRAPGSEPSCF